MATSGLSRRTTLLGGVGTLAAVRAAATARTGAEGAADGSLGALGVGLTDRQQAGQRVVRSYPGAVVPESLLTALRRGEVGGVVFFADNVPSTAAVADAVRRIRAAHAEGPTRGLPLVLTTDQEGGAVRRLPGAPALSARQVGDAADPASAAGAAGDGAARTLRAAGMNLDLAPVVDVFREDGDFDDRFGRSFSRDPQVVAACAAAFVAAQRRVGVASCLKHFPGLGTAPSSADTDLAPVRLPVPLGELRAVDEAPYAAGLLAAAGAVMSSWAVYPALDPARPAGLSSRVLRDELRGRLGFGGVSVSDALEAGGLAAYGDVGRRGVLAAGAGTDLLLASGRSVEQGAAVVDTLVAARQHLDADWYAALLRVATLRRRLI